MSPAANGKRPELKDGEAADRFAAQVERWARGYRNLDDEAQLRNDYGAKFRPEAERLATACTAPARVFEARDWVLAVLLWAIIAGGVLLGSILLMKPEPLWFWVFVGVAVAIFGIGLALVYRDTTSEKRAQQRLREKTNWLIGLGLRAAEKVVRERRAKRG